MHTPNINKLLSKSSFFPHAQVSLACLRNTICMRYRYTCMTRLMQRDRSSRQYVALRVLRSSRQDVLTRQGCGRLLPSSATLAETLLLFLNILRNMLATTRCRAYPTCSHETAHCLTCLFIHVHKRTHCMHRDHLHYTCL